MPAGDRISVLITRPRRATESLARKFRAVGCRAIVYPVLDFEPPEHPESVRARLQSSLPADRLIWPSPAAVRFTLNQVPISHLHETLTIVPGPGTARAARAAGLARVVSPTRGFDSEAMLELPELTGVSGLRMLICNAPGGRTLLARTLQDRGADVIVVPVYRRVVQAPPAGVAAEVHTAGRLVTIISSEAALDGMRRQLDRASLGRIWSSPVVVVSERLARAARLAGAGRVRLAEGVADEALMAAVLAAADEVPAQ